MNEFDKLMKTCEVFGKLATETGKSKVASLGKKLSAKYAQLAGQPNAAPASTPASVPGNPDHTATDLQAKINAALQPYGYSIPVGSEVRVLDLSKTIEVPVQAHPNAKWSGTGHQGAEVAKLLAPLAPGMKVNPIISM